MPEHDAGLYCQLCGGTHPHGTKICPKTGKTITQWEDPEGKWVFVKKATALLLAGLAVGAFFYFGGGGLVAAGLQRAAVVLGLGGAVPAVVGADPEQCPEYKIREDGCMEGFYLSTGGQGTGACEQEVCPPNSHRNYTLECLCDDGFHPVSDPCRSALLQECRP